MSLRTLLVIVGIVVAGIAAYIAVRLVRGPSMTTVWIVNAFDFPLEATVGKRHLTVPAHKESSVRVPQKPVWVVVTANGIEVDRERLAPTRDNIVFNPLGAAHLATVGELYASHPTITTLEPGSEDFGTARVVEPTGVDYWFGAPDKIMLTRTKGGPTEKRIFRHLGTWEGAAMTLLDQGREADAKKLYDIVVAVQGEGPATASVARYHAATQPAPVVDRPVPAEHWVAQSAEKEVTLTQQSTGAHKCTLQCARNTGEVVWSAEECISSDPDVRFVAPDCSRVIILRHRAERDGNVAFVYDGPTLVESHSAAEFGANPAKDAHFAPDGHHIEFSDGAHQLLLTR